MFLAIPICLNQYDPEKISLLSDFAENCAQTHTNKFAVLNYARLTDAVLKLKAASGKIHEGSFVLQIENNDRSCTRICLFADNSVAAAEETNEKPDLSLGSLEATRFLFSPLAAITVPAIRENDFLRGILPLPLFFENADAV